MRIQRSSRMSKTAWLPRGSQHASASVTYPFVRVNREAHGSMNRFREAEAHLEVGRPTPPASPNASCCPILPSWDAESHFARLRAKTCGILHALRTAQVPSALDGDPSTPPPPALSGATRCRPVLSKYNREGVNRALARPADPRPQRRSRKGDRWSGGCGNLLSF